MFERIRALALTALMLVAACGKDGGGLTDPGPVDPGPVDPGPAPTPEPAPQPVGQVVYAVDLENNFLVFGTESFDVLSGQARIRGLPILKRIIGIVYRPSNGKLYGVGNDSRVYTIDPSTAEATPVSGQQFTPKIVDFFEIHFAMALEPNGDRVRLISTEGGGNWSISLDDGTATSGEPVHFVTGDPNEHETPHIAALIFARPSPTAALKAGGAVASIGDCTAVMYMIDPDLASYIGTCDANSGDMTTLGPIENEHWSRCMEALVDENGDVIPTEDNPYGMGGTFVAAMRAVSPSVARPAGTAAVAAEELNSWGVINPDGSITWQGHTRGKAIQSATLSPPGSADVSKLAPLVRVEADPPSAVTSSSDPRANCLN